HTASGIDLIGVALAPAIPLLSFTPVKKSPIATLSIAISCSSEPSMVSIIAIVSLSIEPLSVCMMVPAGGVISDRIERVDVLANPNLGLPRWDLRHGPSRPIAPSCYAVVRPIFAIRMDGDGSHSGGSGATDLARRSRWGSGHRPRKNPPSRGD